MHRLGRSDYKVVLAKTVIDLMENNGGDGATAAQQSIQRLEKKAEGFGGVIVLNHHGVPAIAYNTPRMARAYRTSEMHSDVVEV